MSSTFDEVPRAAFRLLTGPLALALALVAGVPGELSGQPPPETEWTVPDRRARRTNPVLAVAEAIEMGREIYRKECESCHGRRGLGDGAQSANVRTPPPDLTTKRVQGQRDGALFWKITEGRGDMPNTRTTLSDEQRWMVVHYLRTLAPKKP